MIAIFSAVLTTMMFSGCSDPDNTSYIENDKGANMESNVITVLSFLAIIIALIVLIIRLAQEKNNKVNTDVIYEGEFVGQIIDIFEDFLTEKKVNLYNADKQGEPDEAIIYGNDYDFLAKKIRVLMDNWNVTYDIRSDK